MRLQLWVEIAAMGLCMCWTCRRWTQKRRAWEGNLGGGGGHKFVPVAVESWGRLGQDMSRFLFELGDVAAESGGVSKAILVRSAHQRISCALVRGNAQVYYQAMTLLVRQSGRAFTAGLPLAVGEISK